MPSKQKKTDLGIYIFRPKDYSPSRRVEGAVYAEIKEDGHWARVTNLSGKIRVHGHRILGSTGFYNYFDIPIEIVRSWFRKLPTNTCIDGELIWPGYQATDVITAIVSHPEKLEFRGFAVPILEDKEMVLASYLRMRKVVEDLLFLPTTLHKVYSKMPEEDTLLTEISHLPLNSGRPVEGFVLKTWGYSSWWKIKPFHTVDVVVHAVHPGNGKFAGMMGAIDVYIVMDNGNRLNLGGVGTGFSNDQRMAITKKDIGRVCEVRYDDVASQGKLKFPRFVRWRPDKNASDCRVDQFDYLPINPLR